MTNVSDTGDRMAKWIRRIARIWSFPIIVYSLIMLAGYAWNLVTIGKADPFAVESYPKVEALPPNIFISKCLRVSYSLALGGFRRSNHPCFQHSNDFVASNSKADNS